MNIEKVEESWYEKYTKPDNNESILADMIRINIEMYSYGMLADRDIILPYVYTMFERDPHIFADTLSDKLNIPGITSDRLMQIVNRYTNIIDTEIVSEVTVDHDNDKLIQDISISYTTHKMDFHAPKIARICGLQMKHHFVQKYIGSGYLNPNFTDDVHLLNYRLILIGYIKPVESEVD